VTEKVAVAPSLTVWSTGPELMDGALAAGGTDGEDAGGVEGVTVELPEPEEPPPQALNRQTATQANTAEAAV
jgi:hypothetical protein